MCYKLNMQKLNLSTTELSNIINNNDYIGTGSYGLVVKLNDEYLFKFNYKDFIEAFGVDNNRINLHKLGDVTKIIEEKKQVNQIVYGDTESTQVKMIKLAMTKQKNLKHTHLTQGLVYVNDFCIGYILKNHNNMISLYKYQKENEISCAEKDVIIDKIKVAMEEMIKNYIYLSDFATHNILYNPETQQLEIIDFEDSLTCYNKRNLFYEKTMLERFDKIRQSFNKNKQNEDILNS